MPGEIPAFCLKVAVYAVFVINVDNFFLNRV